jgi:dolichyl-phosphate beta-glucosyltransferase
MKISIIIPAYNEENRIYNTVFEVSNYMKNHFNDYEIIVVNDGSTDNTENIVKNIDIGSVSCISLAENSGKGSAVKEGILASDGDVKIYTDADMPFDLSTIGFAVNIIEGGTDVICGHRYFSPNYPFGRKLMSNSFGLAVKAMGLARSDTQCGFKAFSGAVADKIFEKVTRKRFSFDIEVMVVAEKMGVKIYNIPLFTTYTEGSTVKPVRDAVNMAGELVHIYKNKIDGLYEGEFL